MKNYFSIWIIPKDDAPPKIYSLEKGKLKRLGVLLGVLLVIGMFMFGDYLSLLVRRAELGRVKKENIMLKEKVSKMSSDSVEIEKGLASFRNYAKKLNTIAGLESPYALKEVGGEGGGDLTFSSSSSKKSPTEISEISGKLEDLKKQTRNLTINFDILYKFFKEQRELLSCTPSIWPTRGYLTSTFGYRRDPFTGKRAFHWGIDISSSIGQKVWATAKGIVVKTGYKPRGLGRFILIDHGFGFATVYGHLSKILVKPGKRVKRGDVIGLMGSTGRSTGPHLHYEVRVYGKAVNPMLYILENPSI